ncbi:bifunctional DNA primase/polymerase [Promicromonospora soli]
MDTNSSPDLAPLSWVHDAVGMRTAGEAAQVLAQAGIPVFPCAVGAKRPLTRNGFHDASTDPDRVAWWWRRHPTANLAVPTGAASGIDVVDVDVHGDGTGYPALRRAMAEGLVDGWSHAIATPSGGLHLYFPHAPGTEQRSWACPTARVDFRGDGGYVVVPPSVLVVPDGVPVAYRVAVAFQDHPAPVDAGALRRFLDPPPRVKHLAAVPSQGADPDRLAAWVAARPEGGRNYGLFWAACRMVEHGFDYHSTLGALVPAAQRAGLGEREAVGTIRSAYRHARPTDRQLREPPTAHAAARGDPSAGDPRSVAPAMPNATDPTASAAAPTRNQRPGSSRDFPRW